MLDHCISGCCYLYSRSYRYSENSSCCIFLLSAVQCLLTYINVYILGLSNSVRLMRTAACKYMIISSTCYVLSQSDLLFPNAMHDLIDHQACASRITFCHKSTLLAIVSDIFICDNVHYVHASNHGSNWERAGCYDK